MREKVQDKLQVGVVNDLKLSYSRLSSVDTEGMKALIERKELSGEGILMGGLIDTLLFEPDKVKDRYYRFEFNKPTATAGKLIDIIIENYNKTPSVETVIGIIQENKFWGSTKDLEILVKKFDNPEFWGYINATYESKGKTIISADDERFAMEVADILKSHENSKELISVNKKHIDKYAQVEFDFEYKKFNFRGIIDMVVIDNKNKTIQLIDLKTGAKPANEFVTSFIKYRYYLQAALYQMAYDYIVDKLDLEGYELLPFKFLYISRYQRIPITFEVSEKWEEAAMNGFTTKSGYYYRGLNELVDLIYWHWVNKKFDLPKEYYEEKVIKLKDDFIEIDG